MATAKTGLVIVAIAALFAVMAEETKAGSITYSSSGTIQPQSSDVDPWEIGAGYTPFVFGITVDSSASDLSSLTNQANFAGIAGTFSINGLSAAVSNIWLSFYDNDAYSGDTLRASFEATLLGSTERISIGLGMDRSTFAFSQSRELPPVFGDTVIQTGLSSAYSGANYRTYTTPGSPVQVSAVPEPSSLVLWGVGVVGVATQMWRRRRSSQAA